MLKQLMLVRKIQQRKDELAKLLEQEAALKTRAEELEVAITETQTDEEMTVVEESITQQEKDEKDLQSKKEGLEREIKDIEAELSSLDQKDPGKEEERNAAGGAETKKEDREHMTTRARFFSTVTREARDTFLSRNDVKEFLQRVREFKGQQRAVTGAELTIPEVMLDLLRDNLHRYSKLIGKIRLKPVPGKARQNIAGTIPEGVWTEAVGKLNELTLGFNQVEVDGYKVGGFVPVPNSTLEDSDLNLANEIMDILGQAIGLAADKAILYGTGIKMPLGIATRLAQTTKPSDWSDKAPEWVDLHETHLLKFDPAGMTAEEFFAEVILYLGVAKPNYAIGGTFWCMNRQTRMKLLSKAISFNAAGAIVAGMNGTMPIEAGDIVELEFIPDNDIIGGFGSLYLLAERAGGQFAVSEHVKFIEDQTVFKGTARYDGEPVIGAGFIILNINNTAPTTTVPFAADTANS